LRIFRAGVITQGTRYGELFRAFHTLPRARLGDLSAVALLGDQVRETVRSGTGREAVIKYPDYYMIYYDGACIHAALAHLALQDRGKPPETRQRLARPDLERALELLGKARTSGEFQTMIPLDEVRKETLLDPLRSDPRFRLLMMDVAFPNDPFRP
jgi:hypothetical protein